MEENKKVTTSESLQKPSIIDQLAGSISVPKNTHADDLDRVIHISKKRYFKKRATKKSDP